MRTSNPGTSRTSAATSNGTSGGSCATKTNNSGWNLDRKTWEEWLADGVGAFVENNPGADQRRRDAAEVYLARGIENFKARYPNSLQLNSKPKHLQ